MTCTQLTSTIDRTPSTLTARVRGIVRRSWYAYWDWRAREATVMILRSLDERTLRDIGINPSEIQSCVYGKGGDRRRRYDDTWPWRSGA